MKRLFRIIIVILLIPLYIAINFFNDIIEAFEPIAQDVGNNITRTFIEVYSSMYEYWKKKFKWK